MIYFYYMSLTDEQIKNLELTANDIRMSIIDMLEDAGSGHTAGPLGMADIFTALYFHIAKHDPKNPDWVDRDRIILSNGHIVPVRYATMAHAGYFPLDELKTLRKFGSSTGSSRTTHDARNGKYIWTIGFWIITSIWYGVRTAYGWKKQITPTAVCQTVNYKREILGKQSCLLVQKTGKPDCNY
jgi:hypothetical protein